MQHALKSVFVRSASNEEPAEGDEAHAAVARRRCPAGVSDTGRPAPRTAVNASMSPPRESGSGFDALALDGAVDRRAADAEELGDFEGAVLATVYQRDQVRLLATVELGLFATQPTLGLGDLHAFSGTKPDQVGLELSHHREHVEQQ